MASAPAPMPMPALAPVLSTDVGFGGEEVLEKFVAFVSGDGDAEGDAEMDEPYIPKEDWQLVPQ
jgi:hypothetical protein